MEVLECIRSRRSIRYFKDEPVPDDALEKILDAGRWATSAANQQGNEFIVIKDKDTMRKIGQMVWEVIKGSSSDAAAYRDWHYGIGHRMVDSPKGQHDAIVKWHKLDPKLNKEEMLYNAPVMIIPITDGDKFDAGPYRVEPYRTISLSFAIQNMMLVAWELGLGTVTLSIIDPVKLRSMLNIPHNFNIVTTLPFGYPAEVPKDVVSVFAGCKGIYPRRPLEDMVHYEKFDMKKWIAYRNRDPFAYGITNAERKRRVEALGGEWPEDWYLGPDYE